MSTAKADYQWQYYDAGFKNALGDCDSLLMLD